MKYKDFRKLNEADDRVIASVEFTDGTKITIRNIPKAATQSSGFEGQIRAKAAKAKPNLSFSSWSIVGDAEADKIDAPGGGYTPTAEEETDMKNVRALWDHLYNNSTGDKPFTFTTGSGANKTFENPREFFKYDEYWPNAGRLARLRKSLIKAVSAEDTLTFVNHEVDKQKKGEPLRISITLGTWKYTKSIVYNTGDK